VKEYPHVPSPPRGKVEEDDEDKGREKTEDQKES
jgi:hypothetical protein